MSKKKTKVNNYHRDLQKDIRKQKLRKEKRSIPLKKKPRQKNWFVDDFDEYDEMAFPQRESMISAGESERRRDLEKKLRQQKPSEVTQAGDPLPVCTGAIQGLVTDVTNMGCSVWSEERNIDCTLRGSLHTNESMYTNPIAVGDQVLVKVNGDASGVVEKVLPRHSALSRMYRPDVGKTSSLQKLIAANIDQVLIVASWREPSFWPELVDRYLIAAQRNGLDAVLCVNKIDLVEDLKALTGTIQPYQDLEFRVLLTSASNGDGIDQLKDLLDGKTTVLAGLSGVGKSSLLSAVQPGLDLKALSVGVRGKNRNQGRHTTTRSTLYRIGSDINVIDTPGIREFGLSMLDPADLDQYYPEMHSLMDQCNFSDCSHLDEPGCAVREAVSAGELSELRYENYRKIIMSL